MLRPAKAGDDVIRGPPTDETFPRSPSELESFLTPQLLLLPVLPLGLELPFPFPVSRAEMFLVAVPEVELEEAVGLPL